MMTKRILSIILLLALSAMAVAGCKKTPEQRTQHAVERIAGELELNEDQKAQLNKMKDEYMDKRTEMKKLREEIYEDVISLMQSPQIDQGELDTLIEKTQAKTNEFVRFFYEKSAEFQSMLTPEQREKAIEKLKKMKERKGRYRRGRS